MASADATMAPQEPPAMASADATMSPQEPPINLETLAANIRDLAFELPLREEDLNPVQKFRIEARHKVALLLAREQMKRTAILTPALQAKLQTFEQQYDAYIQAKPGLNVENVLKVISDQRAAFMHRPEFTEEELTSVPNDVTSWILLLSQDPSSPALFQCEDPSSSTLLRFPTIRRSTTANSLPETDDRTLRFYARAMVLTPKQASEFDERYSKSYPADLAYRAGLKGHLQEQVKQGKDTTLWCFGITVGKKPIDRLLADLRTAEKAFSQKGAQRRVEQFYGVLDGMGIKPEIVLHFTSLDRDLSPFVQGAEANVTTFLRNIHLCYPEELFIAAAGGTPANLNSASGGMELGQLEVSKELLAARSAISKIEEELLCGIRPASRESTPEKLAAILDFFQTYRQELLAKGEEKTGEVASAALTEDLARLLATPGEGSPDGHLALLLGKDITRGDLRRLTSYFGEASGSGPAMYRNVEHWCNSDQCSITHQPSAPRTSAFADLWSLEGCDGGLSLL